MKPIANQPNKNRAFTIIELLTVMSIIIILIGLLVPALNRVKRYAKLVRQKAQFHAITVALDHFSAEYDGYPPSGRNDETGAAYCGAMKLCEAMVGKDLKGFYPDSRFRRDGTLDGTAATQLYPARPTPVTPAYIENLKARKMYLQLENANAYMLDSIYSPAHLAAAPVVLDPNIFVLCDVYTRVTDRKTAKRIGMPILYYRAEPSKTEHKYSNDPIEREKNTYDYRDNIDLINVPLPWVSPPGFVHPMASAGPTLAGGTANPTVFYAETLNEKIPTKDRPYREDSFILISAGFDGEYGTSDDVFNFGN